MLSPMKTIVDLSHVQHAHYSISSPWSVSSQPVFKLFTHLRAAVNAVLGLSCLSVLDAVRPELLLLIALYLSIDGLIGIGMIKALTSSERLQWTLTHLSFEASARLALAALIFFNLAFQNSLFQIAMMNFVAIVVTASCGLAGLVYLIAGLALNKFSTSPNSFSLIDLASALMSTFSLLLGMFLMSSHEDNHAIRLIGLYGFLLSGLFLFLGQSTSNRLVQLRGA